MAEANTSFVDYVMHNPAYSSEQANDIGTSCVSIGALHLIVDGHLEKTHGNSDYTQRFAEIMRSLGHDVASDAYKNQDYASLPALINGRTITWNKLFETTISDPSGGAINLGEMMRSNRWSFERLIGKGQKDELLICAPLISDLGGLPSQNFAQVPANCSVPKRG